MNLNKAIALIDDRRVTASMTTTIDEATDINRALDMAVEAIEKAEKYKWHDTQKNPKDMPSEGEWVILKGLRDAYFIGKLEDGVFIQKGSRATMKTVIAWRFIEPFE